MTRNENCSSSGAIGNPPSSLVRVHEQLATPSPNQRQRRSQTPRLASDSLNGRLASRRDAYPIQILYILNSGEDSHSHSHSHSHLHSHSASAGVSTSAKKSTRFIHLREL